MCLRLRLRLFTSPQPTRRPFLTPAPSLALPAPPSPATPPQALGEPAEREPYLRRLREAAAGAWLRRRAPTRGVGVGGRSALRGAGGGGWVGVGRGGGGWQAGRRLC